MTPHAVFFDMDDTLLDGVTAMTVAWELTCREHGATLGCEPERLRLAIRKQATEFWKDEAAVGHWRLDLDGARERVVRRALAEEGLDTRTAGRIARDYRDSHRAHLQPFDDAFETLEVVRRAGYRLGLITNGPASLQRDKIERFGIAAYMDVIVVEGEFGAGKPERAVFEHACRAVGAAAADAWHVGDSLYADIGGAKGAGLHAVWLHRDRLELHEDVAVVPDRTIAHLAELQAALGI